MQTVSKFKIRWQTARVLAAIGVCFFFLAYFTPFSNASVSDISQPSRDLETVSPTSLDVSNLVFSVSHDTRTAHECLVSAGDSPVRVETEDLDSFEEDAGHPQMFLETGLLPFGEFSSHDFPRGLSLPFPVIHGLMSRRF
jgi:hypothetical protein